MWSSNATAPTKIYTLSLHDALPISSRWPRSCAQEDGPGGVSSGTSAGGAAGAARATVSGCAPITRGGRSEEHTSELQSRRDLVCRLLLEKKKKWRRVNPKNQAQSNH